MDDNLLKSLFLFLFVIPHPLFSLALCLSCFSARSVDRELFISLCMSLISTCSKGMIGGLRDGGMGAQTSIPSQWGPGPDAEKEARSREQQENNETLTLSKKRRRERLKARKQRESSWNRLENMLKETHTLTAPVFNACEKIGQREEDGVATTSKTRVRDCKRIDRSSFLWYLH